MICIKKCLNRQKKRLLESIKFANNKQDIAKTVESKKIAKTYWCSDKKCYDELISLGEGYEGFGTSTDEPGTGKCANCNKTSHEELFIAKSY